MINSFCEVNKAKFEGFANGTYNFIDENGNRYYLNQYDLRDLLEKQ